MKRLIYLLMSIILIMSCNKTKVEPNPRKAALGTYDFTAKTYTLNAFTDPPQLSYWGSDFDVTDTLHVSASTSNIDGILFTGDEDEISANNIGIEEDGFSFDIPSQNYSPDGANVCKVIGYEGVTLTSTKNTSMKFDGGFFSDTQKMQFFLQTTSTDTTLVFEFNLLKRK